MISRMLLVMHHQAAPLRKALAAYVAHVRPLPGVGEFVDPERGRPGESFRAERALVRFLPSVPPAVKLEGVVGREFLAAFRAQEHLGVEVQVAAQLLLGGEASLVADVALERLRRAHLDPVHHPFVGDQVRSLRVTVPAELADERLGLEMARLVILQIVVGHETFVALVATITIIPLVDAPVVHPQRDLVISCESAYLARVLDVSMDPPVIAYLRGTFECFAASGAYVGPRVTVLHHVTLVIPVLGELQLAHGARVTLSALLVVLEPAPPRPYLSHSRVSPVHVARVYRAARVRGGGGGGGIDRWPRRRRIFAGQFAVRVRIRRRWKRF